MPFGMRNAPATFQRYMNTVIRGLKRTKVYIDDIIIYSDTWEEHLLAIGALFERLSEYRLTVNLNKCVFCQGTVKFLGHTIGQGSVAPLESKIEAIGSYTIPQNKKSLMRFLGIAGFYLRFCPNFSHIVSSLTNLLKKEVRYVWSEECQRAFESVKAVLTNNPVLKAPDFDLAFLLYCDASDVGIGAVLVQLGEDGIEHPVSYYSKKLNGAQSRYSTVEKEALALLLSLQHFSVYLGKTNRVVVYTDHNPLTFLARMKTGNQRLLRWALTLQEHNLDVRHIKGSENVVSDALSRID